MQSDWKVEILTSGRCGNAFYREADRNIDFYWELGGSKGILLIVCGPELAEWDTKIPWAQDRRDEIVNRVAQEIIRQRAPNCVADIEPRSGVFYIREKDF